MDLSTCIDGSQMRIRVRPEAKKTRIVRIEGNVAIMDVAAPAEKGKANAAVEQHISKLLGRPVRIIRGLRGRLKILLLK